MEEEMRREGIPRPGEPRPEDGIPPEPDADAVNAGGGADPAADDVGPSADAPAGEGACDDVGPSADAPAGEGACDEAGPSGDAPAGEGARDEAGPSGDAPAGEETCDEAGPSGETAGVEPVFNEAGPATEGGAPEAASRADAPSTDRDDSPSTGRDGPPPFDMDPLRRIDSRLENIAGTEQRLFSEVREMHRLYHSEFAGRLKSMQDELEAYRKVDKGKVYDDILASLARIYDNNETLVDEVAEPKAKKSIRYMLLDIEDLLDAYGMTRLRSAPGDKRNPRHCQIRNRVTTGDPALHDTVVKSYNSGFHIGNRTVIKEVVDIYFYDASAPVAEAGTEPIEGAGGAPVTE